MQRTFFYNTYTWRTAGAVVGLLCAVLPVVMPGVVWAQTPAASGASYATPFAVGSVPGYSSSLAPGGGLPTIPSVDPVGVTVGSGATQTTFGGTDTSQPTTNSQTGAGVPPAGVPACTSLPTCVAALTYMFAVYVPGGFAYIAATAFAGAVELSLSSDSYNMAFVSAGWTTTRDVANMTFLFIVVFLAITIMMKAETSNTMRTLGNVLLVALIINFSFFGTRVIIDIGNIAAVQIYNILPGEAPQTGFLAQLGAKDLTVNIMNAVGPQSLLSGDMFSSWSGQVGAAGAADNGGEWGKALGQAAIFICMGVVMTVLAVSFFVASIHFVTRLCLLWLLIIVSPLALVAFAIQDVSGQGKKMFGAWWEALIRQSLYPFFFLGVYMLLLIFMAGISGNHGLAGLALGSFQDATGGFWLKLASAVALMAIITTLTVVTIKHAMAFAEDMGGHGAGIAKKAGAWLNGNIVNGYANMTAGRAMRFAVAPLGVADRALGRTDFGRSTFGTMLRGGLQVGAKLPAAVNLKTGRDIREEENKKQAEQVKEIRAAISALRGPAALKTAKSNLKTARDEKEAEKNRARGISVASGTATATSTQAAAARAPIAPVVAPTTTPPPTAPTTPAPTAPAAAAPGHGLEDERIVSALERVAKVNQDTQDAAHGHQARAELHDTTMQKTVETQHEKLINEVGKLHKELSKLGMSSGGHGASGGAMPELAKSLHALSTISTSSNSQQISEVLKTVNADRASLRSQADSFDRLGKELVEKGEHFTSTQTAEVGAYKKGLSILNEIQKKLVHTAANDNREDSSSSSNGKEKSVA